MHCSVIIALIHYTCNYSASLLCTKGSMAISKYFNATSSVILLLCISKPHIVQGLSTRLANHVHAWTDMCKSGGYHYFTCLCPVVIIVISNSISVLEYWRKYPALKLSSISLSSALMLVHFIKKNFNSAYCSDSQYCYRYLGLIANVHVQEM